MKLKIELIQIDGGTQTRAFLYTDTVDDYADAMRDGAVFPPVTVFYDGKSYWLADGFHRLAAARRLAWTTIEADVRSGTRRDAVLYSAGANDTHGLRRTNADKRRAVEALLRDEEWRQWSDREIARRAAVSDRFVNNLRAELYPPSANGSQIERTVQRNGTTYTQNINVHKPPLALNSQRAGVRFDGDGAEPDLDADGQPITPRHADEGTDSAFLLGDIVEYCGQRVTVIGVSSNGRVSIRGVGGQPIHGIAPNGVTLIEREAARQPSVAPPSAEETVTLDGVPLVETHPMGWQLFFIETNWATCPSCNQSHPRWSAVRGGDWRCDQPNCKQLTHDDVLIPYTREDAIAEDHRRNGRHKPKTNYAAPADGADVRDQCQTPAYAIDPLLAYLSPAMRVWEPAYGEGMIAEALYDSGFSNVITGDIQTGENFFEYTPADWDAIVTNPPFSGKYRWLERCYALGKPFALLMPLEVLGAKSAQVLFRQYGVNVIFLSDRVDFKMPNLGWDGGGAQFPVAWFCWGLPVPEQMVFADIEEAKRAFKAEIKSAAS